MTQANDQRYHCSLQCQCCPLTLSVPSSRVVVSQDLFEVRWKKCLERLSPRQSRFIGLLHRFCRQSFC